MDEYGSWDEVTLSVYLPQEKFREESGNIATILWGVKHFKHVCPGGKCPILEASIAVKIAFS